MKKEEKENRAGYMSQAGHNMDSEVCFDVVYCKSYGKTIGYLF